MKPFQAKYIPIDIKNKCWQRENSNVKFIQSELLFIKAFPCDKFYQFLYLTE